MFDMHAMMRPGGFTILLGDKVDALYFACACTGGHIEIMATHWSIINVDNYRLLITEI